MIPNYKPLTVRKSSTLKLDHKSDKTQSNICWTELELSYFIVEYFRDWSHKQMKSGEFYVGV
jgi:hypothetical protein